MNRETIMALLTLLSIVVAVATPEIRCYLGLQRDSCPGVKIPLPVVNPPVPVPTPVVPMSPPTPKPAPLSVPLPEMIIIPAGQFRMGDIRGTRESNEQPVHQVSVNSFAMSRHEVTFEEYDYFAEQTGREKPSDEGWGRGNRPVINVSWDDATAYAEWLSGLTGEHYRLPTEAEWEYAARAGTETDYGWGNEIGSNRANCGGECGSQWDNELTAPVCSFVYNPFGLCDMAGNVWEWTCSAYEEKYNGEELKCTGKEDSRPRVTRGGAWYFNAWGLRASYRGWLTRVHRGDSVGFRLARM